MSKNTNKLVITGPADKLNTIRERFRDFGVTYEYADEKEGEEFRGTATGGIPQPPVVLNTKERMDAVQPNTRIAPNFIDPAAYPGQDPRAGGEAIKDVPVSLGAESTGTLVKTPGNNNAEFNQRVEEEVQKRVSQETSKKALEEKQSRKQSEKSGEKQDSPDQDKADKAAGGRSTKGGK